MSFAKITKLRRAPSDGEIFVAIDESVNRRYFGHVLNSSTSILTRLDFDGPVRMDELVLVGFFAMHSVAVEYAQPPISMKDYAVLWYMNRRGWTMGQFMAIGLAEVPADFEPIIWDPIVQRHYNSEDGSPASPPRNFKAPNFGMLAPEGAAVRLAMM